MKNILLALILLMSLLACNQTKTARFELFGDRTRYVNSIKSESSYHYTQVHTFHYNGQHKLDSVVTQVTDLSSGQPRSSSHTTRFRYAPAKVVVEVDKCGGVDILDCSLDSLGRVAKVVSSDEHNSQTRLGGAWVYHPTQITQTYQYNKVGQMVRSSRTESCTECADMKSASEWICRWEAGNLADLIDKNEGSQEEVNLKYGAVENNPLCNLDLGYVFATTMTYTELAPTLGFLGFMGLRNQYMADQILSPLVNQYKYIVDSQGFITAAKLTSADDGWVEYTIQYTN